MSFRFAWLLAVLAVLIPAASLAGPVAGTYFLTTHGGGLEIGQLPSGEFELTPRGPAAYAQWWATMDGDLLRLEWDYSLSLRRTLGAVKTEAEDRPYFLCRASGEFPGGWDLVELRDPHSSDVAVLDEPLVGFLRTANDVSDRVYFRLLDLMRENPPQGEGESSPGLMAAAGDVLEVAPEESWRRIAYLDALVRAARYDELDRKLADWAEEVRSDPNFSIRRMLIRAEGAQAALLSSRTGENAWDLSGEIAGGMLDYGQLVESISSVHEYDDYLPHVRSLFDGAAPNFLGSQVSTRVVVTESYFQMMRGEREKALDALAGVVRFGQAHDRGETLIGLLIGVAIRQYGFRGFEVFVLNACETREEFDALWERLERLEEWHQEWRTEEIVAHVHGDHGMVSSGRISPEAEVRNLSAAARYELLRAVALVREAHARTGEFPKEVTPSMVTRQVREPHDPFTNEALRFAPEGDAFALWAVGPDKRDDGGRMDYDPTNGTFSGGDIVLTIPPKRRYPFPKDGFHPQTTDDVESAFPNGLPPDPFADTRGRGLTVHPGHPPNVFSFGPDADQGQYRGPESMGGSGWTGGDPFGAPGDDPFVRSAEPFAGGDLYMKMPVQVQDEPQYDPTNGTVSQGNLYYRW